MHIYIITKKVIDFTNMRKEYILKEDRIKILRPESCLIPQRFSFCILMINRQDIISEFGQS